MCLPKRRRTPVSLRQPNSRTHGPGARAWRTHWPARTAGRWVHALLVGWARRTFGGAGGGVTLKGWAGPRRERVGGARSAGAGIKRSRGQRRASGCARRDVGGRGERVNSGCAGRSRCSSSATTQEGFEHLRHRRRPFAGKSLVTHPAAPVRRGRFNYRHALVCFSDDFTVSLWTRDV
jgi:hypothetical protein